MTVISDRIDEVAREVAQLRRRVQPESSLGQLADRLACRVQTLDCMTFTPAAELFINFMVEGIAEDVAVEVALQVVDARTLELRRLLGEREQ